MPNAWDRTTVAEIQVGLDFLRAISIHSPSPRNRAKAHLLLAYLTFFDLDFPNWKKELAAQLLERKLFKTADHLFVLPDVDTKQIYEEFLAQTLTEPKPTVVRRVRITRAAPENQGDGNA